MFELTDELRSELEAFDTPTVCNALELVAPKRQGHGYTTEHLFCIRPQLKPIIGIARTARIRSAHPNDLSREAARKLSDEYYAYIDSGPKPSVVVIQDIDTQKGYGSFWGEVNSSIHLGLGCRAVVTDGGVRDLPDLAPGFQVLAGRIIPSHAFVHVVDFGYDVTVSGMRVRDGDLVHLDQHGAVVIPRDVASGIKAAALKIQAAERKIIEAARQPGFTAAKLRLSEDEAGDAH
jgi:regulator of RNase E activity RraA